MRILIVSHEYPPVGGGGANACMFLSKEYADKGHQVDVVTVWYEGQPEIDKLYNDRVAIYRLKSKRKHKEHCGFAEMLDYLRYARKECDQLAQANKYDVCQVFFGIPSGPLGYYLKKKYGIPYVIRFGGGDIPGFQNRFAVLYKLLGPPLKIIWKNASGLVANSEGLKKFALDFCNKYPIDVIYNGVDTNQFYPAENKNYGETVQLLFVSRLIERKGLQDIIPYLTKIQNETGKKVHLTIVGDGPYRERLEQLAVDAGTDGLIAFVGQKEKGELRGYYQQGDIFVFPSRKEGMPNAVLEAMACGLPVIMMKNCEGAEELIDGNGVLADEEITGAVREFLMLDKASWQAKAAKSRSRAMNVFSWTIAGEKYLSLFDQIVQRV